MKLATAKIVPNLKNFERKQRCYDIAQEMLSTFNDHQNLLKKVITGDDNIYDYDIKTKLQTSRFNMIEAIKEKSKQKLLAVPFSACFEKWKKTLALYCYAKRPIIIRNKNNKQKLIQQLNEHSKT